MIDGRIIKGVGGLYFVKTDRGIYRCKARGVFRKKKVIPAVGDQVKIQIVDEEKKEGYINHIYERNNLLLRPRVANVDCALILFANQSPAPNFDFLDRLVLLAEEAKVEICIGINKMDLGNSDNFEIIREIYENVGYKVFNFIAVEGVGIETIKPYINGKVFVLAGPSGVGKSSLINKLYKENKMETGELSLKIGRGKHTTRHAELIDFDGGGFVVDTPGFTSLELTHIPADSLDCYFREFEKYRRNCRFTDCRHVNEPGCAVKEAVGQGISPLRYQRYVAFYEEACAAAPTY